MYPILAIWDPFESYFLFIMKGVGICIEEALKILIQESKIDDIDLKTNQGKCNDVETRQSN